MSIVDRILKEAMEEMSGLSTKNYQFKVGNEQVGYINVDILPSKKFYTEFEENFTPEEYQQMFGDKFMMIKRVYVDKDHAGQGIGKQMINKAFEIAKVNGCDAVVLNASPIEDERMSTSQLVNYYSKFGFQKVADLGDDALMAKTLN